MTQPEEQGTEDQAVNIPVMSFRQFDFIAPRLILEKVEALAEVISIPLRSTQVFDLIPTTKSFVVNWRRTVDPMVVIGSEVVLG